MKARKAKGNSEKPASQACENRWQNSEQEGWGGKKTNLLLRITNDRGLLLRRHDCPHPEENEVFFCVNHVKPGKCSKIHKTIATW